MIRLRQLGRKSNTLIVAFAFVAILTVMTWFSIWFWVGLAFMIVMCWRPKKLWQR